MGIMAPTHRFVVLNVLGELTHIRCLEQDHVRSALAMFSSVQFSHAVVSDSLRPHESQHARPPCPSPTPGVHYFLEPS